jgi:hypothetical protein
VDASIFDFEGSAIRGVERHYRAWGAEARLTLHITKATALGAMMNGVRQIAIRR